MSKKSGLSFDGGPVGYKRPPIEHQFKKGQKPMRTGKGQGSQHAATHLTNLLKTKVTVNENGKRTRMSALDALTRRLVACGLRGNATEILRVFKVIAWLAPEITTPEQQVLWIRTISGNEDE